MTFSFKKNSDCDSQYSDAVLPTAFVFLFWGLCCQTSRRQHSQKFASIKTGFFCVWDTAKKTIMIQPLSPVHLPLFWILSLLLFIFYFYYYYCGLRRICSLTFAELLIIILLWRCCIRFWIQNVVYSNEIPIFRRAFFVAMFFFIVYRPKCKYCEARETTFNLIFN